MDFLTFLLGGQLSPSLYTFLPRDCHFTHTVKNLLNKGQRRHSIAG